MLLQLFFLSFFYLSFLPSSQSITFQEIDIYAPNFDVDWGKTEVERNLLLKSIPIRGWNSYDGWDWSVTEQDIIKQIDYIADHMLQYEFRFVVVDFYWYLDLVNGHQIYLDDYGRLLPDPNRFPSSSIPSLKNNKSSGFTQLAAYAHRKGLLFGIHVMRGISKAAIDANLPIYSTNYSTNQVYKRNGACEWGEGGNQGKFYSLNLDHPGGVAFYQSLYDQYAEWGIDFIKNDCVYQYKTASSLYLLWLIPLIIFLVVLITLFVWIVMQQKRLTNKIIVLVMIQFILLYTGITFVSMEMKDSYSFSSSNQFVPDQIMAVASAINSTGRSMLLSISPGQDRTTSADQVIPYVNMFRITVDTWDRWESIYNHFEIAVKMSQYINIDQRNIYNKASVYADLDMLPLGFLGSQDINEPPHRWSGLTQDEQITLLTLWVMFKSPLFYGGDLSHPDPFSLSLLSNQQILDINANSINNRVLIHNSTLSVWIAEDGQDTSISYFSIQNIGDDRITTTWNTSILLLSILIEDQMVCHWQNIWFPTNNFSAWVSTFDLEPHQSILFRLSNCGTTKM